MNELEIESLLREWMSRRWVVCSREDYAMRKRPGLLWYAALCDAHGDEKMATNAREALEDLDRRFNFAE